MIRPLLIATTLATLPGLAQLTNDDEEKPKPDAISRLPIGATLTKFSHPRFDENKHPVSLLTADKMVITSEEVFTGEGLVMRLFGKDKKVSSFATVKKADFWVKKEHIVVEGRLFIRATDDQFLAEGRGGILHLQTQQGLLLGPARTLFKRPPKKRVSMKLSAPLLLATVPLLTAAPPPEITKAEVAEFEKAFSSTAASIPPLQVSTQELGEFERAVAPRPVPQSNVQEDLEQATLNEIGLTQRLTQFLTAAGQASLLAQQAAPAPKPLSEDELFTPGPNRIVIKSDRGIYLDGSKQEFVYLGNVRMVGKGIAMSCTNGVKAIMTPPPPKKKKKPDDGEKKNSFDNLQAFGDLKQLTASGSIILRGKDPKGQPVELRAGRALYNAEKSTMILRGKKLFFRRGDFAAKSESSKAIVKIKLNEDGSIIANLDGPSWETGVTFKEDKKKK